MPYNFSSFQLQEVKRLIDSLGAKDAYREYFNIPYNSPIADEEISQFIGDWIVEYRSRIKEITLV